MFEYKIYSNDIWDYLEDMPYMPSRYDRDSLIQEENYKRLSIWDYFFRINPEDVGKPQKTEIDFIDKKLSDENIKHHQKQKEINDKTESYNKTINQIKIRVFYYGLGCSLLSGLIYYFLFKYELLLSLGYKCVSPFILLGIFFLVSIRFVGWREKRLIKSLQNNSLLLRESYEDLLKRGTDRKLRLRSEIRELKLQIPEPEQDLQIREWLQEDFKILWGKSKEVTALSNRLIPIESGKIDKKGNPLDFPNPVAVVGPAELQRPEKKPKIFSKIPDLKKHLSARKSFYMSFASSFEVLYGIYYLEHILIADDMLATYGLFYDFITGKHHAEEITEQYYKDVVAISTTHEFREIEISINEKKTKYIEDAPTFTLSLASGEHRTVTFVSKKYFMEIKEEIFLTEDDVSKIYWVVDAKERSDMAVGALRARLRIHKESPPE